MPACGTANHLVRNEPDERQRAERVTGKPYDGAVEVLHVLDVLVNRFGLEGIRKEIERPLTGLRVACYYGCLLTRPPEVVAFDNAENPTCMDDLAAAAGADPVAWPYKTECCGASLSITQSKVVGRLGRKLLLMARQAGARCIVVACPLCQLNLDLRQSDAAAHKRQVANLPRVRQIGNLPYRPRRSCTSRSFWDLPWDSRPRNWGRRR